MMLFLIFLLLIAAVGLLVLAFAKPKAKEEVQTRLKRVKGGSRRIQRLPPKNKNLAFLQKMEERLQPLAQRQLNKGKDKSLKARMDAAGLYQVSAAQFVSRQILCAAVVPIIFFLADWVVLELPKPVMLAGMLGAIFLGYFLPVLQLNADTERRKTEILRNLPTTLDLLTTCVEAGLSLQAALSKVTEMSKDSPLKIELERTLKEVQLGRPRGDALRELGKRVGLKELNSVTIALVQAETMGSSIS
ncbi:MAG TPA: type II secretion system F family protein, partial [Chroococcales cyanobacterium]